MCFNRFANQLFWQQVILMAYDQSFGMRTLPTGSCFGECGIDVYLERECLLSLFAPRDMLTVSIIQLFMM